MCNNKYFTANSKVNWSSQDTYCKNIKYSVILYAISLINNLLVTDLCNEVHLKLYGNLTVLTEYLQAQAGLDIGQWYCMALCLPQLWFWRWRVSWLCALTCLYCGERSVCGQNLLVKSNRGKLRVILFIYLFNSSIHINNKNIKTYDSSP